MFFCFVLDKLHRKRLKLYLSELSELFVAQLNQKTS